MPRHPRKRYPTTTSTPTTTQAARKGDAEIPSDLDVFFLELDALFNAHSDRQQIDSLHAQMVAEMRNELGRDAVSCVAWLDTQHSEQQQPVVSAFASTTVETEDTTTTTATQQVLLMIEAVAVAAVAVEVGQMMATTGSGTGGNGAGGVVDTFVGGGGGGVTLDSLEQVFVDVERLLDTLSCGIIAY
ncbi:hypothetical protein BJ741DRAFT_650784 [Chytriomyces cf. hyalinus JEL632]|nr:hypothetical protein BJ741DRAFT_650784 [Chytriomyces cf. hyalinus JEL632]